ncbi:hypothetical protein GCM10012285_57840 [Streptomyces kronopolitis]|uniref:Uncharacterized protein n=1 Tax=Streptomyces kronopolitis TaxID=1612435 RepID=A0ABQ2JX66_9ACTN|nr:hypothetical protein GCM10012285_57840 [Streptomyces kronopolitis]
MRRGRACVGGRIVRGRCGIRGTGPEPGPVPPGFPPDIPRIRHTGGIDTMKGDQARLVRDAGHTLPAGKRRRTAAGEGAGRPGAGERPG